MFIIGGRRGGVIKDYFRFKYIFRILKLDGIQITS